MSTPRVGVFPQADRMAIFDAARRLQLDPYELGGFLSLESGKYIDPNIRGGAGGKHYGMIQFGPAEQQKYLDPNRIGKYTRAEQMPKAVQFLLDRGFKPGQMGIDRAYATVLGGNPNVSLNAKDSFGTSVQGALSRFKEGGDLNKNARRVLGDLPADFQSPSSGSQASGQQPQEMSSSDFLKGFMAAMTGNKEEPLSIKDMIKNQLMTQLLTPQQAVPSLGMELFSQLNPYA